MRHFIKIVTGVRVRRCQQRSYICPILVSSLLLLIDGYSDSHAAPVAAADSATQLSASREPSTRDHQADWFPVGDAVLEKARGGFDLGGGLMVTFGLTRTITINGQLTATTSIQIPDLAKISREQSAVLAVQINEVKSVQNGQYNSVGSEQSRLHSQGLAIIQNSLDNQSIKSLTTIDANVGSLSILKTINLQSTIRDAMMNSISGH